MPEHVGDGEVLEEISVEDNKLLETKVRELWGSSISKLRGKNDLVNSLVCLNILKAVRPYVSYRLYKRLHQEYVGVQEVKGYDGLFKGGEGHGD